jgi:hypothetical protein
VRQCAQQVQLNCILHRCHLVIFLIKDIGGEKFLDELFFHFGFGFGRELLDFVNQCHGLVRSDLSGFKLFEELLH